ncbi:c-type cytochrome [Candidatus Pelagibacter sp.]|uniref:c-type cytochrome n=1 Tax=Candidatus Pelagibacter sp. TaxID=2024849 RepID=UPI003F82BCBE
MKYLRNLLLFSIISFFSLNALAEQSVEDIIKGRQQIFDRNYTMAKRVQALSEQGKFDEAINLMVRMNEGYKKVINMFPENTKEGFGTEALPTIWKDKENFNQLMVKTSDDLIKLTSLIKETDNIEGTLGQFMWGNCKACHNKYREEH